MAERVLAKLISAPGETETIVSLTLAVLFQKMLSSYRMPGPRSGLKLELDPKKAWVRFADVGGGRLSSETYSRRSAGFEALAIRWRRTVGDTACGRFVDSGRGETAAAYSSGWRFLPCLALGVLCSRRGSGANSRRGAVDSGMAGRTPPRWRLLRERGGRLGGRNG